MLKSLVHRRCLYIQRQRTWSRRNEMGDLSKYPDYERIAQGLIKAYNLEGFPINDARACDDFVRVVKPGDRIVAKRGRDEVVGYGIVTGEFEYRAERTTYRNVR